MKKANIDMPSQKLKCIAMTRPKNAPAKCKAKYNAINISFIEYLIYYIDYFCQGVYKFLLTER